MTGTISRRHMTALIAALGAMGGAAAPAQEATPAPGADGVDGIAGGGVLRQGSVDVPFSLMAFTVSTPDDGEIAGGFLHLVDETTPGHQLVIEAREILSVQPLSAQATGGRQVTGFGTLNGRGRYPFMLQVEDLGAPGSGEDTFNLVYGEAALPFLSGVDTSGCDCGGLGYGIRSAVISGDISTL